MENIVAEAGNKFEDITFKGLLLPSFIKNNYKKHPLYAFENWHYVGSKFEDNLFDFLNSLSEAIYITQYTDIYKSDIECDVVDLSDLKNIYKLQIHYGEYVLFSEGGFLMINVWDHFQIINSYGENSDMIFNIPLKDDFHESISVFNPPGNAEKSGYMPYLEELRATWR